MSAPIRDDEKGDWERYVAPWRAPSDRRYTRSFAPYFIADLRNSDALTSCARCTSDGPVHLTMIGPYDPDNLQFLCWACFRDLQQLWDAALILQGLVP